MLARMELGLPPLLPPTPRTTRSHAATSDSESESSSVNEGEDSESESARASVPASSPHHSGLDLASTAPLDSSSNDLSFGKSHSDTSDDDEGEYEVDKIMRYRRVGKKRGGYEYLTRWVGGEESWEPQSSFKLAVPDLELNSHYLPVYDDYKSLMNEGNAIEDHGEMSAWMLGEK